jgi:hypothetical protein
MAKTYNKKLKKIKYVLESALSQYTLSVAKIVFQPQQNKISLNNDLKST